MPEPGFLRAVEVLTDALLTPQEFARHKPSPDQMTLRWVTIHPHGDGEEGRRIQINTETGEIEKGFGAGKTMHEAFALKSESPAASDAVAPSPASNPDDDMAAMRAHSNWNRLRIIMENAKPNSQGPFHDPRGYRYDSRDAAMDALERLRVEKDAAMAKASKDVRDRYEPKIESPDPSEPETPSPQDARNKQYQTDNLKGILEAQDRIKSSKPHASVAPVPPEIAGKYPSLADAPEKSGQVSPSPEKSADERKPFKPEGIPGEKMGLFDQDAGGAGGQKSLFNVVKPDKKSKKTSSAAPSELEKIGDEHKARSEESAPLPGQKSIEDQYPSLKGFAGDLPKHHLAVYNGKAVPMDYITNPKEQFKRAAQRIVDNGASGHVVTPDGKVYAVGGGSKSAKLVTGDAAKAVIESVSKKDAAGTEKPEPSDDDWKPENHVKIAADDISKLRKQDVYRLMESATGDRRAKMADYIRQNRPELAEEVQDSLDDLGDAVAPKPSIPADSNQEPIWKKGMARRERGQIGEISGLQSSRTSQRQLDKLNTRADARMGNATEGLSGYSKAVIESHSKGEVDENTPGIHADARMAIQDHKKRVAESERESKARNIASENEIHPDDLSVGMKVFSGMGPDSYEVVKINKSTVSIKRSDGSTVRVPKDGLTRMSWKARQDAQREARGQQFSRRAPHEELIHHLHEAMNHDGKCCYEKEEGEDDIADHAPADHRHMDKAVHELCRHLGASHPELQAAYESYTAAVE